MAFACSCVTQSFENEHIYRAFYGSHRLGGHTGSKSSRYRDLERFLKIHDMHQSAGCREEDSISLCLKHSNKAIYTSSGL